MAILRNRQFVPTIARVYDPGYTSSTISIFPNPTNPPISPAPNINCTAAMLLVCGDQISVSIHPSNKYLFVADQTTSEVAILYVSSVLQTLVPSEASIPGLDWIAFSPDGLLVYAAENNEILVYVFNPHTGLLTARTSIAVPGGVGAMLPAQ
jgi:DNA-binding beta-propeller fold protein YncE